MQLVACAYTADLATAAGLQLERVMPKHAACGRCNSRFVTSLQSRVGLRWFTQRRLHPSSWLASVCPADDDTSLRTCINTVASRHEKLISLTRYQTGPEGMTPMHVLVQMASRQLLQGHCQTCTPWQLKVCASHLTCVHSRGTLRRCWAYC